MGKVSQRKQRQEERNWKPPQIETLTQKQATYLDLLNKHNCTVATGPAGTGKTYIACAWAGDRLHNKDFQRCIVARPTVAVGRTMGFLPGDAQRKMAPWARPLAEAFKQQMGSNRYEKAVSEGKIRIEPLEHIRGLTFDQAIMILDEAQNTTPTEMKAFLTRVGEASTIIISGDKSQSDLSPDNGLAWALAAVERGLVSGVGAITFTSRDVVRSGLCRQWGEAWDVMEQERKKTPAYRGSLSRIRGGELV